MVTPYYQDDAVTIYHGDCRDVLSGREWDAVVTDPPYPTREDLFSIDALDVLDGMVETFPSAVFWPANYPVFREPDAVHVWYKSVPIHPNSKTGNTRGHQYERVLLFGLGKVCRVLHYYSVMPGFAACAEELTVHPTQKPLPLLVEIVRETVGVVLDPFMGSGTTLRAAKDLGRKAIGIEIEEKYCEIAAKRMQQEVLDFG